MHGEALKKAIITIWFV